MSLHTEISRQLRTEFRGTSLVILDKDSSLEIVFRGSLDMSTLQRVDRVLTKKLKATVFAQAANIVVRIEKEIPELAPIIPIQSPALPVLEPSPIIQKKKKRGRPIQICAFCDGKGRIADLLTCYKCRGSGKMVKELEDDFWEKEFWDWGEEENETEYKPIKYYVAGVEVDFSSLFI